MIYKTLHMNLATLAVYPAIRRQIQKGVRYLDVSLFKTFSKIRYLRTLSPLSGPPKFLHMSKLFKCCLNLFCLLIFLIEVLFLQNNTILDRLLFVCMNSPFFKIFSWQSVLWISLTSTILDLLSFMSFGFLF